MESFWAFAKGRSHKFHGIADSVFYLHPQECEAGFENEKSIPLNADSELHSKDRIIIKIRLGVLFIGASKII